MCHAHLSIKRFIVVTHNVGPAWSNNSLNISWVDPLRLYANSHPFRSRRSKPWRQPRTGWRGWSTRTTWSTGRCLWTRSLRPAYPWTYQLLETIWTQIWHWNLHHDDPWWSMMIYDDLWGSMNDPWWSMMMHDDLWWSMIIDDNL